MIIGSRSRNAAPTGSRWRYAILALAVMALVGAACGETAAGTEEPTVAALPESGDAAGEGATEDGAGGSGAGAASTPSDPPTDEEAEAAQLRYEQCLADQGVNLDEVFGNFEESDGEAVTFGIEVDDEADFESMMEDFDEANQLCEPILEEVFGSFELSPEQEAAFGDANAAFSECMAEAGFEIDAEAGANTFGFEIDTDNMEKLDAAMADCQQVMQDILEEQGIDFGSTDVVTGEGSDS